MAKMQKSLSKHEIVIIEEQINTTKSYQKIVKAGISQWIKDFQNGNIKINSIDDLKKLLEVDMQLQKSVIESLDKIKRIKAE